MLLGAVERRGAFEVGSRVVIFAVLRMCFCSKIDGVVEWTEGCVRGKVVAS